jgi:hypothetical protein
MTRNLSFTDGLTSGTEPTRGTVDTNKLKVFANTAAFVADKGSPAAEGDQFLNSTSKLIEIYRNSIWEQLVDESSTQTMTSKTLTSPTLTTPAVDVPLFTQQTTPSNPSASKNKLYFKSDNNLYKLNSGGTEEQVGSGGGAGGINLLDSLDRDAESSVGNWSTYQDAAGSLPVDGDGGSPNVLVVRTTTGSEILNGVGSYRLTKDAANRQGEGISVDINPVAIGYRSSEVEIQVTFKKISGTYTAGALKWFIYDVDNTRLLTPFNNSIDIEQGILRAVVTLEGAQQIRLICHVAGTDANSYVFSFDDISVGPREVVYGANITKWRTDEFTFTPSASFGTTTEEIYRTRRVGDSLEAEVYFKSGTNTASTGYLQLPTGITIDTSGFTSATDIQVVGKLWTVTAASTSVKDTQHGLVFYDGSTTNQLFFGLRTGVVANDIEKTDANSLITSGFGVEVRFTIPVSGWDPNVSMANGTTYNMSNILVNGTQITTTDEPASLGEYKTFIKNASSIAGTVDSSAPAITAANGMRLYAVNYATAGTAGQPNRWEMFIGFNKYYHLRLFQNAAKTDPLEYGRHQETSTALNGIMHAYDANTGILSIDTMLQGASVTARRIGQTIPNDGGGAASPTNGYFEVYVSENALAVGAQSVRAWQSFTMTIGAVTTPPTKGGTIHQDKAMWRRVEDSMEITYTFRQSSAGTAGSGTYLFPIPGGYSIDSDKIVVSTVDIEGTCGFGMVLGDAGGTAQDITVSCYDTGNLTLLGHNTSGAFINIGSASYDLAHASTRYSFRAVVPIVGW